MSGWRVAALYLLAKKKKKKKKKRKKKERLIVDYTYVIITQVVTDAVGGVVHLCSIDIRTSSAKVLSRAGLDSEDVSVKNKHVLLLHLGAKTFSSTQNRSSLWSIKES